MSLKRAWRSAISACSASSVLQCGLRLFGGAEELVEQRRVADNRSRVGQRQQKLRVVLLKVRAFAQLAHVMTDGQPEVPQRIEKRVQEALVFSRDRIGKEQQQVDIRVKAELLAAVAAERENADRLTDQPGIGKELLDDGVHPLRVALERDPSALAPLGSGRQLQARRG